MLETKLFEIRDVATFIPVIATNMCPDQADATEQEKYLLHRGGFSPNLRLILLSTIYGGAKSRATWEPYDWGDRTFHFAHLYITEHWDELASGDVVDVQFILHETAFPKLSERQ